MRWTYRLTFESAFSSFSGLAVAGLVDRMVVRDRLGLPVVNGSTIKGRWRHAAERLLRALPADAAGEHIHIHDENAPVCKSAKGACTVCKWFGSPAVPGALQVGPGELTADWADIFRNLLVAAPGAVVKPDTEVRPGTALSRVLRTPVPDHLFFDEAVPSVTFSGSLIINATPSEQEKRFLIGTAAMVGSLGARKAAGRGRLTNGIAIDTGGAQ